MREPSIIDLHTHSTVSDGTDSPEELLALARDAGIALFSLTDHDAVKGCVRVRAALRAGDPAFVSGVEFSCQDELGKYHILGYGYDVEAAPVRELVERGHSLRVSKTLERLDFLRGRFGFDFSEQDRERLFAMDNPGKPHIANLMVQYGYAASKQEAIRRYINLHRCAEEHVHPALAIAGIRESGGVPVLAHPCFGDGDELIRGAEMEQRVCRLTQMGLRGLEAFYSGFTPALRAEMLALAERFGLFATAGSDYHGANKSVPLACTSLDASERWPSALRGFLEVLGL